MNNIDIHKRINEQTGMIYLLVHPNFPNIRMVWPIPPEQVADMEELLTIINSIVPDESLIFPLDYSNLVDEFQTPSAILTAYQTPDMSEEQYVQIKLSVDIEISELHVEYDSIRFIVKQKEIKEYVTNKNMLFNMSILVNIMSNVLMTIGIQLWTINHIT